MRRPLAPLPDRPNPTDPGDAAVQSPLRARSRRVAPTQIKSSVKLGQAAGSTKPVINAMDVRAILASDVVIDATMHFQPEPRKCRMVSMNFPTEIGFER